jgi:hypothetical protein
VVDEIQDWHLIDGKEIDGYTILKYKRPLKSCDAKNDLEIKAETNYLIFAWNDEKPVNGLWKYHGQNRRIGVELLFNFKPPTVNIDQQILDSENSIKVNFTLKNVYIGFFLSQEQFLNCLKILIN